MNLFCSKFNLFHFENPIKNNINTTSLFIDNLYINDLTSKNISLNKIKLPKINNLNSFDYNNQIGTLLFRMIYLNYTMVLMKVIYYLVK